MSDRLAEIKQWRLHDIESGVILSPRIDWLIQEVERLRQNVAFWKNRWDEVLPIVKQSNELCEARGLPRDLEALVRHERNSGLAEGALSAAVKLKTRLAAADVLAEAVEATKGLPLLSSRTAKLERMNAVMDALAAYRKLSNAR